VLPFFPKYLKVGYDGSLTLSVSQLLFLVFLLSLPHILATHRFWLTVAHPLLPTKLVSSGITSDG